MQIKSYDTHHQSAVLLRSPLLNISRRIHTETSHSQQWLNVLLSLTYEIESDIVLVNKIKNIKTISKRPTAITLALFYFIYEHFNTYLPCAT